jgi:amino acid transporter
MTTQIQASLQTAAVVKTGRFGTFAGVFTPNVLTILGLTLAVLVAALLSFLAGGWDNLISPTWSANYDPGVNFWLVFAVFFPAVTGIAVGASLSGDLKDPSRSQRLAELIKTAGSTLLVRAGQIEQDLLQVR